jgi:uncharacterized phage protein (TIGR02220 family)
MISVVKWDSYQDSADTTNKAPNKEVTKAQQRPNKDLTTNKNDKTERREEVKNIIDFLNDKSGSNFKHTTATTQKHISARLKEGFVLDDFEKVIVIKVDEWSGTDYEKFIRPETLFGNKFESYLNQTTQKRLEEKELTPEEWQAKEDAEWEAVANGD